MSFQLAQIRIPFLTNRLVEGRVWVSLCLSGSSVLISVPQWKHVALLRLRQTSAFFFFLSVTHSRVIYSYRRGFQFELSTTVVRMETVERWKICLCLFVAVFITSLGRTSRYCLVVDLFIARLSIDYWRCKLVYFS